MHQMYLESIDLPDATLDSISHFTSKLGNYVALYPDSRQDEYFDPTLKNLRGALSPYGYTVVERSVTLGVTVNTEWDGETFIEF